MRVVADENIPGLEALLDPAVELVRVQGRSLASTALAGADALLVRSVTTVDESLLKGTPVRFVGSATSGYDHIDIDYLQQAGIQFAHAPGANANSVVEYVLAAIAAVDDFLERLLAGSASVGIVGFGHVGSLLAARLDALAVEYCVYDPWLDQGTVARAAQLDIVLDCDIVTLHPQLTDKPPFPSRYLIDEDRLAKLSGRNLLINASRGSVINNAALLARLRSPNPPAAVLDVWENEPSISAELLSELRFGTAHIAGYSLDSKFLGTAILVSALFKSPTTLGDVSSVTGEASLSLTPQLHGVNLVRHLMLQHCPIAQDDALLRTAQSSEDPGAAFDGLRRNYAPRYELAGKRIPDDTPTAQGQLLQALGCDALANTQP